MSCSVCKCVEPFGLLKPPSYEPEGPGRFSTHLLYPYVSSLLALQDAVRQGCDFCSAIAKIIDKTSKSKSDDLDDWEYTERLYEPSTETDKKAVACLEARHAELFHVVDEPEGDHAVFLELIFHDTFDLPRSRNIELVACWEGGSMRKADELSIVASMPDELSSLMVSDNIRTNSTTSSAYALSLARYWYQQCVQQHELCRSTRHASPIMMPTRVIDVSMTRGRQQPFLYEPNGQPAPYVCLSHCWGTGPALKTTMASLQSHKESIPLKDMPQTFRDAVEITQRLGQQYLWIDSLCIVQDSNSDWQKESAVMGDIYKGSLFTIFAVDASGDSEGFFKSKPSAPAVVVETPMFDRVIEKCLKTGPCKSFAQRRGQHVGRDQTDSGRGTVFDAVRLLNIRSNSRYPLDRRAWTLQESILTTCSLNYEQHEISWSCPTTRACECVPEGFGAAGDPTALLTNRNLTTSHDDSSAYSLWYDLVSMYTKREITYSKDKLPALAGLAAEFSRIVQSKYLAGLWADDLRDGLAWHLPWVNSAERPENIKWSRPQAHRAPSWSWASVDGETRHGRNAFYYGSAATPSERSHPQNNNLVALAEGDTELSVLEAQIISHSVEHLGVNPFGEVTAGTIRCRGRLKHAFVRPHEKKNPRYGYWMQRGRLSIFDDQSGEDVGGFEPDESAWNGSDVYVLPLRADAADAKLQCLALELAPAHFREEKHASEVRCFRRAGMVWMFGSRPRFESDGAVMHPAIWFSGVVDVDVDIV